MSLFRFSAGMFCVALIGVTACDKKEAASEATGASAATPKATEPKAAETKAADVSCDAVVAKLMSLQTEPAGDAEKKMFGKMCEGMDAQRKACIVSAGSMADVESKCGSGKAF